MVILRFTLNCWDGKWLMSSREVNVMQSSQGIGIMNKPIKADMWVYALSFLTVFLDLSSVIPIYTYVHYLMLLIVGVFIYLKLPIIISGKNWMSFAPWMVFVIGIVVSSFLSKDIYTSRNPLLAAIVALGGLLEFIAVINYAFKKNRIPTALNVFCITALIILLCTDIAVYLTDAYLIGNKFRIAYFHMLFIVLFVIRKTFFDSKKNIIDQILFAGLIVLTIAVCVRVDCATGINAMILMIGWFFLGRALPSFVYSPITVCVAAVFSYVFMYIATSLSHISFVTDYIVNTLHRDATLTGRLPIFEVVPRALSQKPILGYGYGISYEVLDYFLKGAPDTQNALAEWILYGGYVAAIMIILILALNFKVVSSHTLTNGDAVLICVAFIYAFICIGTIEISYGIDFFAVLALLRVLSISSSQREGAMR